MQVIDDPRSVHMRPAQVTAALANKRKVGPNNDVDPLCMQAAGFDSTVSRSRIPPGDLKLADSMFFMCRKPQGLLRRRRQLT